MPDLPQPEDAREWLATMTLIRRFEERAGEMYARAKVGGRELQQQAVQVFGSWHRHVQTEACGQPAGESVDPGRAVPPQGDDHRRARDDDR